MCPEIDAFLEMQVAEHGASPNTVSAYRRDLESFSIFLKERNYSLIHATSNNLQEYIVFLKNSHYAIKTQSRHLSALREFYRFLYSEDIIQANPTDYLSAPKTQKSLPKYLTEADVFNLIHNAEQISLRLQTLLEILYATGMRVSELVGLPVTAVTHEKKHLYIIGKGNKERKGLCKIQYS